MLYSWLNLSGKDREVLMPFYKALLKSHLQCSVAQVICVQKVEFELEQVHGRVNKMIRETDRLSLERRLRPCLGCKFFMPG